MPGPREFPRIAVPLVRAVSNTPSGLVGKSYLVELTPITSNVELCCK